MKIGLVLSGGGVRCVAQIGILKVMEEMGIQISAISGTSGGAIIGALYAHGYAPDEIMEMVSKITPLTILRPAFKTSGVLDAEKIELELRKYISKDTFEDLKLPLFIACTNFLKAKTTYFDKGDLIRPISASAAIPIVFSPVKIGDSSYFDGGIMDNLPVRPLLGKCDKIVGVHCNPLNDRMQKVGSMRKMFERTMLMAISCNAYRSKEYCDVFLEPEDLKYYRILEYKKIPEIFEIGYKYAEKNKSLLEKLVK